MILGDEYNVLEQLNLPSLPVGEGSVRDGRRASRWRRSSSARVLAAMSGGKVGERYHKRVDRAGFVD